ncbi:MAG TPA: DUF2085 domain-containing protein [Byssovorax sp.]
MVLHATGPTWAFTLADLPFNLFCHRMPERTLVIFGVAMPICSRCAGLWFGLSLSAFFMWPAVPVRVLRVVFPVALALMAIEVATQDLGWHPVFHPTRLLSGLLVAVPFGGALGTMLRNELVGPAS